MRYVLAYDVSEDRNRQKIADLLLDHGDRVQKSVFEADLSLKELKEIVRKAEKYLQGDDSLRIYALCETCRGRSVTRGRPEVKRPAGYRIF